LNDKALHAKLREVQRLNDEGSEGPLGVQPLESKAFKNEIRSEVPIFSSKNVQQDTIEQNQQNFADLLMQF